MNSICMALNPDKEVPSPLVEADRNHFIGKC
jgi:hypothetical protein